MPITSDVSKHVGKAHSSGFKTKAGSGRRHTFFNPILRKKSKDNDSRA